MALQVNNAPGQAGYVLLVFDQDIDASPLRLAICNRISRTYLGHSVGKANWSPARSHFFDAVLVSRGDGETVFKLGPEVTTFIPDETTVELTSEDDAVREVTVWRSVLLDFHWKGPDVNPDDEARRLREEENLRRQRSEAERRRRDAEAESKRRAAEDEEKRKLAAQAAEAEKARQLAAAEWQRKNAEDERKQLEAKAAEAERMRREAEAKAEAETKQLAAEDEEKRKLAAQAAEAEKARQLAAADWQRKESEQEAARLAAVAADAEKRRRDDEAEQQRKEAEEIGNRLAAKVAFTEQWRAEQLKEEEENRKQAEEEAKPKQEEDKALRAIALEPVEQENAPPQNLIARDDEGKKERARAYKGMVAVFAAIAALWIVSWGLEHRSDVCVTFGLFCERTDIRASGPDSERDAFERARACTNGVSCGVAGCVADYRRAFPDGRFKASLDAIVAAKGLSCSSDTERDVYDRAVACAAPKSCDAAGCLADYRRAYPNGRFKSQIESIGATKGQACPVNNLERQVYDRAIACTAPLTCGAMDCLTDYRRQFPSGYFIVQINVLAATKGVACSGRLPPFVRRTSEDPGINCAKANLEPIEDMICADGDIARVNGELQRAFDAKRLSLRGTARDALVNQERTWIQSRDRDCNVPGRGPWSQMDLRRVKNCVIDKTRARRDELQR